MGFGDREVDAAEALTASTNEGRGAGEAASAVERARDGRGLAGCGGETADTAGCVAREGAGAGAVDRGAEVPGEVGGLVFEGWRGMAADFDVLGDELVDGKG